jgi:hypothetical protein
MHANSFTLEAARDHEAELFELAAPNVALTPRSAPRRKRWLLHGVWRLGASRREFEAGKT